MSGVVTICDGGAIPEGQCDVAARSPLTGKVSTMRLPVTAERVDAYVSRRDPRLVQVQLPELSSEQREFLMTGYTPEDWAVMFPKRDDDEEEAA